MKKAFTLLLVTVLFLVTNSILLEAGGESEQAGKKVSLTVWLGVADLVRMCEDAIPEFQKKYPNAQVEVLAFPLREAEKKIALALSGGTAPDVYMLSEAFNLQHMQKGYNAPAPADVSEFVKSKTYPVYVDPMMFQGKVYGVPYFHGHILLFWNKGHFADAGIASQPKNWN
ncbi:MAG TPA: ABC transporter substrate-binding protein, partial [Spirochaetia bacterium]|nr:ABC transporter substrate-binding protein [Spirochaetia bacterium]